MDKAIALRFDTIKEISVVKTLIEMGLTGTEVSPGDAKTGREIIKVLDRCAELMKQQNESTK